MKRNFARNPAPNASAEMSVLAGDVPAHALEGQCSSPRSADEFWIVVDWTRSPESLGYHAETLVSWAPIEILESPVIVSDDAGKPWHLCKFRYFGPVRERGRLIASAREALCQLGPCQPVGFSGTEIQTQRQS